MLLGKLSVQELSFERIGGGEFVIAIMIYYVLLYFTQRYFANRLSWIMGATVVATLIAYWFFPYKYETSSKGIYGITTLFRWIPYFGMMLMGAWCGINKKKSKFDFKTKWTDVVFMAICLIAFYGIQFAAKRMPAMAPLQIITIPFLAGIVYYFWKCCNAEFFGKIYKTNIGNWMIMAVGGLCLESYLIQMHLFTDKLNWLFPLNIPIIMLYVLIVAYVCRCIARSISQTFRTEDYEWGKVFAIK